MFNKEKQFSLSSGDCEAEVELISLSTEKLPLYKLRADSHIKYDGYHNSDFQRASSNKILAKSESTNRQLTYEQIKSTLEYFLLCGLRVNKMTETYEDVGAMRLLIQEQRSQLDLASKIGTDLVEKTEQLESRNIILEEELESKNETILQLKHQLTIKDGLLEMIKTEYLQDYENDPVPFNEIESSISSVESSGFNFEKINVKKLEDKLLELEEENKCLKNKYSGINSTAEKLEYKEQQLVDDCVRQLLDSTKTIDKLTTELNKKTSDYLNQHEEISRLLTGKIDLENKIHHLLSENDQLVSQVREYQTRQFTMTKELSLLRDRYDECLNILNEKQDQLRIYKRKYQLESMRKHSNFYSGISEDPHGDSDATSCSLAAELAAEESLSKIKMPTDKAITASNNNNNAHTLKLMEQARCVNNRLDESFISGSNISSGFCDDEYDDDDDEEDGGKLDPNSSVSPNIGDYSGGNYILRRSIRDDCQRRRIIKSGASIEPSIYNTMTLLEEMNNSVVYEPNQKSSNIARKKSGNFATSTPIHQSNYRKPEKLQLIKPMQGSQTLRAWQNLATPSLTKALFDSQPSHTVCFRGGNSMTEGRSLSRVSGCSSASSSQPGSPVLGGAHRPGTLAMMSSSMESTTLNCWSDDEETVSKTHNNKNLIGLPTKYEAYSPLEDKQKSSYSANTNSGANQTRHKHDLMVKLFNECNTPINETNKSIVPATDPLLPSSSTHVNTDKPESTASVTQNSTWISNLVTNILGQKTPSSYLSSSAPSYQISNNNTSSLIISKLTNLPPLAAIRRLPSSATSSSSTSSLKNSMNVGLNLLLDNSTAILSSSFTGASSSYITNSSYYQSSSIATRSQLHNAPIVSNSSPVSSSNESDDSLTALD